MRQNLGKSAQGLSQLAGVLTKYKKLHKAGNHFSRVVQSCDKQILTTPKVYYLKTVHGNHILEVTV